MSRHHPPHVAHRSPPPPKRRPSLTRSRSPAICPFQNTPAGGTPATTPPHVQHHSPPRPAAAHPAICPFQNIPAAGFPSHRAQPFAHVQTTPARGTPQPPSAPSRMPAPTRDSLLPSTHVQNTPAGGSTSHQPAPRRVPQPALSGTRPTPPPAVAPSHLPFPKYSRRRHPQSPPGLTSNTTAHQNPPWPPSHLPMSQILPPEARRQSQP